MQSHGEKERTNWRVATRHGDCDFKKRSRAKFVVQGSRPVTAALAALPEATVTELANSPLHANGHPELATPIKIFVFLLLPIIIYAYLLTSARNIHRGEQRGL